MSFTPAVSREQAQFLYDWLSRMVYCYYVENDRLEKYNRNISLKKEMNQRGKYGNKYEPEDSIFILCILWMHMLAKTEEVRFHHM